jgi:cell division protein FtsA
MFRVGDLETLEPYHKKGNVLSVKCVLVTGDKKTIYDLIDILLKCELEVIDITSSGLSDYYNFKNTNYDVKTGVVINLGNTSTIINIISKGIYINSEILDTGGYDIDKDIAFGYNLKRTEAKYLKETLASASIRTADAKETLKIANKDGKEIEVNQYELSEIVANRLSEILKLSKKSINHLTKKEISYIIITGGLTEIKDFSIELSSIYGENVKIGTINNIGARQNKFSASVGTLIYFNDKLNLRNKEYSTISENDIELMCNKDSKIGVANDSILGKVFGYFFDN